MKLKNILAEEKIAVSKSAGIYVIIDTGTVTIVQGTDSEKSIQLTKTSAMKLCEILSEKLK